MPIETIKRKQWNVAVVQIISDYSGALSSLLSKCSPSIVIPQHTCRPSEASA